MLPYFDDFFRGKFSILNAKFKIDWRKRRYWIKCQKKLKANCLVLISFKLRWSKQTYRNEVNLKFICGRNDKFIWLFPTFNKRAWWVFFWNTLKSLKKISINCHEILSNSPLCTERQGLIWKHCLTIFPFNFEIIRKSKHFA